MAQLLHKERLDWKGTVHDLELYEAESIEGLHPIKQVQAVAFVDRDHIVIYKHIDGYYGLPGGSVEDGEGFDEALKREVYEESACEVLECGVSGYIKDTQIDPPGIVKYQLRYWATVRVLDEPVNDPAGKALSREVVTLDEAVKKLGWGEKAAIQIRLAVKRYDENHGK